MYLKHFKFHPWIKIIKEEKTSETEKDETNSNGEDAVGQCFTPDEQEENQPGFKSFDEISKLNIFISCILTLKC